VRMRLILQRNLGKPSPDDMEIVDLKPDGGFPSLAHASQDPLDVKSSLCEIESLFEKVYSKCCEEASHYA
jgi:hypothetical protein